MWSYKKRHIQTYWWGILFSLGFLKGFAMLHGGITTASWRGDSELFITALLTLYFSLTYYKIVQSFIAAKTLHTYISKHVQAITPSSRASGCLKCSLCSPKPWHNVLEGRMYYKRPFNMPNTPTESKFFKEEWVDIPVPRPEHVLDMLCANRCHLDWGPHRPSALRFCQSPPDLFHQWVEEIRYSGQNFSFSEDNMEERDSAKNA